MRILVALCLLCLLTSCENKVVDHDQASNDSDHQLGEYITNTCLPGDTIGAVSVVIDYVSGQLQGQLTEIVIGLVDDSSGNYPMGGYDFLVQYDAEALSFMRAEAGQMVNDCGWEYFSYRTGCNGNGCPSGMIRLVALAEMNDGGNHPDCFTKDDQFTTSLELVRLIFLVTSNRDFECQFVPIRFTWFECTDNIISNVNGDSLLLSGEVYDYDSDYGVDEYVEITDYNADLPSISGAPIYCDTAEGSDMFRRVKYYNGGIQIVCKDSIDERGDINLDGVPYSVADAVMFSDYFIYGLEALVYIDTPNQYGQIPGYAGSVAASDINADGLSLSVVDFVYLIRIIVGDANPIPRPAETINATISYSNDGLLTIVNDIQTGAALVVVRGEVNPTLLAENMEMKYAFDGINTRVLVYSFEGNSFGGDFLIADGEILIVEIATAEANPVVVDLIPSEFELAQNYPNPFDSYTTISFNMPQAGDYALTIYNVAGQVVHQSSGSTEAGVVSLVWDASDYPTGVYLYKLTTASFSATKMMLVGR